MIKSKELLPLTGYVHGGCSPIGMKKLFPTFLDETAQLCRTIYFSAGKIGYQIEMTPDDLQNVIPFQYSDLIVVWFSSPFWYSNACFKRGILIFVLIPLGGWFANNQRFLSHEVLIRLYRWMIICVPYRWPLCSYYYFVIWAQTNLFFYLAFSRRICYNKCVWIL